MHLRCKVTKKNLRTQLVLCFSFVFDEKSVPLRPKSTFFAMHTRYFVLISCVLVGFCSCQSRPSVEQRRQEKRQQDSLSLVAQEKSYAYYDSLRTALLPVADSLLKEFRYEKNEQYEDYGHYTHKLLCTTANTQRNYIQTSVRDNGAIDMRCFYYGGKALGFESVTLSMDSLQDHFLGSAHAFESGGWHEMLTLSSEDALRLLHFIDSYTPAVAVAQQGNGTTPPIRICYEGTKSRTVWYLTRNDAQAMMSTYRLGITMQDICQLEMRLRATSLQISKYRNRLNKDSVVSN